MLADNSVSPLRWPSYCVLGRVIEAVTGRAYHEFVRTELWDKLNIPTEEIGFGRSLLGQQAKNEVAYCTRVVLVPSSTELLTVAPTIIPLQVFESTSTTMTVCCS